MTELNRTNGDCLPDNELIMNSVKLVTVQTSMDETVFVRGTFLKFKVCVY